MSVASVVPPRRVEAELVLRSMQSGRNGALLVQARAEDDTPVDCVVKLKAGMAREHAAFGTRWRDSPMTSSRKLQGPHPTLGRRARR